MVTHLAIARRDGRPVNPASGRDGAVAARRLAAAAAAATVAACVVVPRAARLRRGVQVLRHRAVAAVVALPRRYRRDGAAVVRSVGLRQVVGVFRRAVGGVADVVLGGALGLAAAVRTVGLRTVGVGVGVELPSVRGCGRHDHLRRGRRSGRVHHEALSFQYHQQQ